MIQPVAMAVVVAHRSPPLHRSVGRSGRVVRRLPCRRRTDGRTRRSAAHHGITIKSHSCGGGGDGTAADSGVGQGLTRRASPGPFSLSALLRLSSQFDASVSDRPRPRCTTPRPPLIILHDEKGERVEGEGRGRTRLPLLLLRSDAAVVVTPSLYPKHPRLVIFLLLVVSPSSRAAR